MCVCVCEYTCVCLSACAVCMCGRVSARAVACVRPRVCVGSVRARMRLCCVHLRTCLRVNCEWVGLCERASCARLVCLWSFLSLFLSFSVSVSLPLAAFFPPVSPALHLCGEEEVGADRLKAGRMWWSRGPGRKGKRGSSKWATFSHAADALIHSDLQPFYVQFIYAAGCFLKQSG